jgi:hypothetical protein
MYKHITCQQNGTRMSLIIDCDDLLLYMYFQINIEYGGLVSFF